MDGNIWLMICFNFRYFHELGLVLAKSLEKEYISMLEFRNIYKSEKNIEIKNMSLIIKEGECVNLECSPAISDLLINLITGKELQNRGDIYLSNIENKAFLKKNKAQIGVIRREEAFYDHMTVGAYMRFFSDLIGQKADYKLILNRLALLDATAVKIKNLTYSQKRRLSFAREQLKNPWLLIFQEPILNLDKESTSIMIENLEALSADGTAILNMSAFFKDMVLMGGQVFRLDEDGLAGIPTLDAKDSDVPDNQLKPPAYHIEKITARMEDRILLFDPMEIDFIESELGVSILIVRGERFPCTLSMNELEERLLCFGFFRCHRSYLVNLQRLKEVITFTRNSYCLSLDDKLKSTIPLSKGRFEKLKDILKL